MRFRFTLTHPESGQTLEISEPDGWKDAVMKLDRHEEFHGLIEYFEGSFIFYGNNGVDNGGITIIKSIIQNYGIDTTIVIVIDFTYDEITFLEIFTGQLSLVDKEEMPNNKMRVPVIPDDRWAKFIARIDTPVNLRSDTDLDGNVISSGDQIRLRLTSQTVRYRTLGKLRGVYVYGAFELEHEYVQVDWDEYTLDEVSTKYTYPIAFNSDIPFEKFSVDYTGDYYFKIVMYMTQAGVTIDGLGNVTWVGYADMDNSGPVIEMQFLVNGLPISATFTQTDHGTDLVDGYSKYVFEATVPLEARDLVTITGKILTETIFFPILLGYDVSDSGQQITDQILTSGSATNFPDGITTDNEFTVIALTSFPESNSEGFLLHDAAGYIIDRISEPDLFYSELLGSPITQYRQYSNFGCSWRYVLIKGLQARQYTLDEKSFFQSFMQWWKGVNPILNLSLNFDKVLVPEIIDVSPDVNLIAPLADWENAGGPFPGVTWDYTTFGHPFVTVNGAGGTEGYTVGAGVFDEDQIYPFDTQIQIGSTGSETPNVVITWAILDSAFNEIVTRSFNYVGAGVKSESFVLLPESDAGAYFGVRIENNTPTESKNFEVLLAFSEDAQIIYHEETFIRIEGKEFVYDDSDGTSVDFYNVRQITSKYDNDRIFNKASIGYAKWESEDISGIDDPQSKKTYATRFKKVGKGIELYSEFIGASLVIEKTRRTTREKSADYKYDNETFIIAINEIPQEESPDISPDLLTFIPELDENFSSVENLLSPETRYNLRITPARNLLRWQEYLQGALQHYVGSKFMFSSAEGNYDVTSTMTDGCENEIYDSNPLSEKQDITVTDDYLHLPDLYEATIPMEWSEYQTIRDNKRKPIGISLTDSNPVPMFIKTLSFKPVKGEATVLMWAKEYLDLSVIEDTTPMQECIPVEGDCPGALTDEGGNILTDELGVCLTEF